MAELVTKQDLALAIDNVKLAIDNNTKALTIRLGSMIGAGIAVVAILDRLFHP
jgi:hypothetical protein